MCCEDSQTVNKAIKILEKKIKKPNSFIQSPDDVVNILRLRAFHHDREVFTVVFLNSSHGVISVEDMFHGTLTCSPVYIREIIRRALLLNAHGIIVSHNHVSSGKSDPSGADGVLTTRIKAACDLMEIKFLDHIIIGDDNYFSFANKGLI
jgi:DNA repair protein RadC